MPHSDNSIYHVTDLVFPTTSKLVKQTPIYKKAIKTQTHFGVETLPTYFTYNTNNDGLCLPEALNIEYLTFQMVVFLFFNL